MRKLNDPELLALVREFEDAERREGRLRDAYHAAEARREAAGEKLRAALEARGHRAEGLDYELAIAAGGRVYFSDLLALGDRPEKHLGVLRVARLVEG